ncbi:hypothetical protein AFL01nite_24680 [Aeromicrobium flavum]|uniref:Lipoprotein n=1 Tax=Aeromicrobium flavum TaxID=416568 RepID=A0A512HXG3_9ACTN|nr:hypothetical protein [Aeromicrobium flavum]GEO90141.1 hypothetical protein AFL01nite_24680 [Aeromicrobium flavum]
MTKLRTAVAALVGAGLVAVAVPSSAQPRDCAKPVTTWVVTDVARSYASTGIQTDWTYEPATEHTLEVDRTATARVDARVSPALASDAEAVLAAAAAASDVPLTRRFRATDHWIIAAYLPQDARHLYRLRLRQETRTFTATKYELAPGTCRYVRQRSGTGEMPRVGDGHLVWDTDRADA